MLIKFLDPEIIVQSILLTVIIIQTLYIGNTMRFNRRINQYQLTHEWNQQLRDVYRDESTPHLNDSQVYENEYQNLIIIFQDMHHLFKDKLLKSSDFSTMFVRLYVLTNLEAKNKSPVFYKNYIILKTIYNDFNNIDVGMILLSYVDNSVLDDMSKTIDKNSFTGFGLKSLKENYSFSKFQRILKIGLWIQLKVKKQPLFELPSINEKDNGKNNESD